jgi:Tol biopolymer transport system component
VWSPDGQSIVFGSFGGTVPILYEQVFVMGADGSNPRPISSDGWTKQSPAWSPDGNQVAVFSWDDILGGPPGAYENVLAIYDLATGQRTIHHRAQVHWLANGLDLSPDGRYVAFTQTFSTVDQYGYRILILDLQTGLVTPLLPEAQDTVNPNYFDFEPVWSR